MSFSRNKSFKNFLLYKSNYYFPFFYLSLFFIYITLLISPSNSATVYDTFKSIPKLKEGFSTFKLGIPNNCKPLYYIDINSDKLTDIIASCKTSKGGQKISYFLYDDKKKSFNQASDSDFATLTFDEGEIISFIANDINKDGFMDYILTLRKNEKNFENKIFVYNTNSKKYDLVLNLNNNEQNLFVADIGSRNNRGLKIIFYEKPNRKVFYYNDNEKKYVTKNFTDFLSDNTQLCDSNNKFSKLPFESPNNNAFIDIDGDCINDIIISSYDPDNNNKKYVEIWKGIFENKEIKYCLSSLNVYSVDDSLGLFTVVDVDRNAMPDLVFPIINSSPPKIVIASNTLPINYDWTTDYCNDHIPINLDKSNDKVIIYKIFDNFGPDINTKNIQTLTIFKDNNFKFYTEDKNFPFILRFSDINQDSYPDFITILKNKSTNQKKLLLFISQKNTTDSSGRRSFNQNKYYQLDETNINTKDFDLAVSSFFDFDEDRKMDILVSDVNGNILCLYNNNIYDSYTLKSILVQRNDCYFCTEIGSSQRFITTNIDGARRMDLSLQSAQISAPGLLGNNFAYLGIGRSNNYIENFHIISGNAYQRKNNDKTYTPVIPNSQLVIYHELEKGNNTSWKVDLVVKPTKYLYQLIIVIILVIIVMTFYVFRLQLKEREEDNIENKETFAPWFG